ncbi:pleiotropic drug resistance protein ABC superfamily [Phytophthora cinnamomi]|uniref:pleiotropic drug resistance protein ABC superfamily n=1 Tax=Phytophthora cinnamomi TaxID=4785 RepID=UPI00355961C2|nr:pleiotropic drug resistance protein ABC superfamily [Phytophthora cinnamomi]
MLVQYLEALPGVKKLGSGKSIAAWTLESVGEGSSTSLTTTAATITTTTTRGKARTSTKKKKYASGASMSTGSETTNHEKETRIEYDTFDGVNEGLVVEMLGERMLRGAVNKLGKLAVLTFTLFGFWSVATTRNFALYWLTLAIFALGQVYLGQWLVRALANLMSWMMMLTPQRFALDVLLALVFGATPGSCAYDTVQNGVESKIPCRELRLIPSDEIHRDQQLTVHSYAELEYGAERGSVQFRLVQLGVFLLAFRFLVIMALKKRQTSA